MSMTLFPTVAMALLMPVAVVVAMLFMKKK